MDIRCFGCGETVEFIADDKRDTEVVESMQEYIQRNNREFYLLCDDCLDGRAPHLDRRYPAWSLN